MILNEAKLIIYTYNEGMLKKVGKAALVGGAVVGGAMAAPHVIGAVKAAAAAPAVASKLAAAKSFIAAKTGIGAAPAAKIVAPGTGPLRPNTISSVAKNPLSLKPAIAPGTGPIRPTFVKPTIPTVKPLMRKPF